MCDTMNSMYGYEDTPLFGGNLLENTLSCVDLDQGLMSKPVDFSAVLNNSAPSGGDINNFQYGGLPSPSSDWMSEKMDLSLFNLDDLLLVPTDQAPVKVYSKITPAPPSPSSSVDSGVSSPKSFSSLSDGSQELPFTCDSPPTNFSHSPNDNLLSFENGPNVADIVVSESDDVNALLSEFDINVIPDEFSAVSNALPVPTVSVAPSSAELELILQNAPQQIASPTPKSKPGRKSKVTSTQERKQRKRDQNKNAATRYRERKRQEVKELEKEEDALIQCNRSLTDKVSQITREIDYLKELMIEVYRIKGLIA